MDASDERALKILDYFASLPRVVGPVTLTDEYLAHIARVEAMPQNQPGSDKSAHHRAEAQYRHHYRRVQRA